MVVQTFDQTVGHRLQRVGIGTIQINVGKLCNQACLHCHVEAGPKRTEQMTAETAERVMDLISSAREHVHTIDITGGAPELNPSFRPLVEHARSLGIEVIDRCNLTVLFQPGQEDTARFLADQGVQITASLPCYSQKNVDQQRGKGVFGKSIQALQDLNALGYGSDLTLNLVYNPGGAFLPPPQHKLRADYRQRLFDDFGIVFTDLFTITNMPIKRFAWDLERSGKMEQYMQLLVDAYNPATIDGLMCRDQISIGWDGQLYDCDFNQMLEIPANDRPQTIWQIDSFVDLVDEGIAVASHCFGCTAGAGSSCGGALA